MYMIAILVCWSVPEKCFLPDVPKAGLGMAVKYV